MEHRWERPSISVSPSQCSCSRRPRLHPGKRTLFLTTIQQLSAVQCFSTVSQGILPSAVLRSSPQYERFTTLRLSILSSAHLFEVIEPIALSRVLIPKIEPTPIRSEGALPPGRLLCWQPPFPMMAGLRTGAAQQRRCTHMLPSVWMVRHRFPAPRRVPRQLHESGQQSAQNCAPPRPLQPRRHLPYPLQGSMV